MDAVELRGVVDEAGQPLKETLQVMDPQGHHQAPFLMAELSKFVTWYNSAQNLVLKGRTIVSSQRATTDIGDKLFRSSGMAMLPMFRELLVHTLRIKQALVTSNPQTLEEVLEVFMADRGIRLSDDGQQLRWGDQVVVPDDLDPLIGTFVQKFNFQNGTGWGKQHLTDAMRTAMAERARGFRDVLKDRLRYSGRELSFDPLWAAIRMPEEDWAMLTDILRHWMWQVKRRLNGDQGRLVRPLFLVLKSPQESGKSYLVDRILEPFGCTAVTGSLTEVCNLDRYGKKLADALVVNFEEMAVQSGYSDKEEQALLQNIKSICTAKDLQFRPFQTQSSIKLPVRTSMIGTTNLPLSHILCDEEGMRRFFVIETVTPRFDWDALNAMDWVELWRSVDEGLLAGYMHDEHPCIERVKDLQKTYAIAPSVRTFLAEHYTRTKNTLGVRFASEFTPEEGDKRSIIPISTLHQAYTAWCEDGQQKAFGIIRFFRMVRSTGAEVLPLSPDHDQTFGVVLCKRPKLVQKVGAK